MNGTAAVETVWLGADFVAALLTGVRGVRGVRMGRAAAAVGVLLWTLSLMAAGSRTVW